MESARAHSYYSVSTGMEIARAPPFCQKCLMLSIWCQKVSYTLYVASKSVLDTLDSVKKCLVDSLSVRFEVGPACTSSPSD